MAYNHSWFDVQHLKIVVHCCTVCVLQTPQRKNKEQDSDTISVFGVAEDKRKRTEQIPA